VERRGISIFWPRQVLEIRFLLALVPAIAQLSPLQLDGRLLDFLDRMVMRCSDGSVGIHLCTEVKEVDAI
jgi:hypothetical protein